MIPIGVEPKHIWQEKRARELVHALDRYARTDSFGIDVTVRWAKELAQIMGELYGPQQTERAE